MKPKYQRLLMIGMAMVGLGIAATLILVAFQDALVFFYTPSDLHSKSLSSQQRIRVGGIVEPRSVFQKADHIRFNVTDQKAALEVTYQGLLPDLFREGQGVIVEGYLIQSQEFKADAVLAKHDETYMPLDVAQQIKLEGCKTNDR